METTRRDFLVGCAGCGLALGLSGCTAVNPAPLVEADANGGVAVAGLLEKPGDQIKVRLSGVPNPVLVWKTADGVHATSIVCTHMGSEVHFDPAQNVLECPSHGSRYDQDGKVLCGPARKPLTPYRAAIQGQRLEIRPL